MFSSTLTAQDEPYKFTFAPDLWYNDVDGIRTGVRVFGEVEGSFKDGPHRLDAGLWLGTWFPDLPVSYYVSFTEPIKAISDYGNEGSVQLISSIRTGYSRHRLQFNKRWQPGFDEYEYKELAIFFSQEKMFDAEYRPFPQLWQTNWKSIIGLDYRFSGNHDLGQFLLSASIKQNLNNTSGKFTHGYVELQEKIDLNKSFKLRIRGFIGFGSDNIVPEYKFLASMNSSQNWLYNGISRAKGTIPNPWLEAGSFQVGGGANLRGYLNPEINELSKQPVVPSSGYQPDLSFVLESGYYTGMQSFLSSNIELEFPNFINKKINEISIIGDLTSLRSYLFFDAGRSEFLDTSLSQNLFDAGLGLQLSINIPDYLGKDRGIFIRYDIPFWLSDVSESESNFSFRQLIGLGAIISF